MGKNRQREHGSRTRDREARRQSPVHEDERPPLRGAQASTPLKPKTAAQADYLGSIDSNIITFGVGPAGTGKSYVAARRAGELLRDREIRQILLTRPAVESGRGVGYLPGTLEEKFAPYIRSYMPGLVAALGAGPVEYHLRTGDIAIEPLEFMQGRSWDEPVMVLFDEAENATRQEMKMFLTRIGENARVVIDGDPDQAQIRQSGLIDSMQRLAHIRRVGVVRFSRADIVRSGIVREILDAYDDAIETPDEQLSLPGFITHGHGREPSD